MDDDDLKGNESDNLLVETIKELNGVKKLVENEGGLITMKLIKELLILIILHFMNEELVVPFLLIRSPWVWNGNNGRKLSIQHGGLAVRAAHVFPTNFPKLFTPQILYHY